MSSAGSAVARSPSAHADVERFRLRNFVESLAPEELELVAQPLDLIDLGARLDGNPKAVLFRAAGPEQAERWWAT